MNKILYDIVYEDGLPQTKPKFGKGLGTENGLFLYETTAKLVFDVLSGIKRENTGAFKKEDINDFEITIKTLTSLSELARQMLKAQDDGLDQIKDILNNNDEI